MIKRARRRQPADLPDLMGPEPKRGRSWRIGILILVGILGLPTIGLAATDHLLRQADEHRATDGNALSATAVAFEVAQSYQQRELVFRNLPRRPDLLTDLATGNRSHLSQLLRAALADGPFCQLALRSPGMAPVVVAAPGPCWSPPAPTAGRPGIYPLPSEVAHAAFVGLNATGVVPGHPATSLQAVFTVRSLTAVVLPGAGSRATVVAGMAIASSSDAALIGKVVRSPGARALIRAGRPGTNTIYGRLVHAEVIEAYRPVPGTGLGVFFSVTTKVAYAPADHASRVLFVGYLVLLVVGFGLAGLVTVMLRRRDQARRTAARHYRSLAEATPDGVAIVDDSGSVVYANPALTAMVGAERPETWRAHPTRRWTDLSPEEAAEVWGPVIYRQQRVLGLELPLRHADGHMVPVEINSGPFDLGGRPGMISVIRDLTQRRAAEAAVAVAEARQRVMVETVAEGIVVYEVDATGGHRPVLMNPAAIEISGHGLGELRQMSASRRGPELVDEDGRQLSLDDLPVAVVARTGEPNTQAFGLRDDEGGLQWLRTAAKPFRDPEGTMIGIVSSLVDITAERLARTEAEAERARFAVLAREARQSEAALRQSEERFRTAFEHAPIGKALIGLDGRFEQVNQALCAITGYTDAELQGRPVSEITHPDDVPADLAARQRLLTGEVTSYVLEKRYITVTGDVIWASKSASLLRSDDGAARNFIVQIQDITQRKHQEQMLFDERRRLQEAQSIGRVGSWEMDLTTGEVVWSDSFLELYGLDRDGFAGKIELVYARIHPDDRAAVRAAATACITSGVPVNINYRVVRASDGELRWFEAHGARYEESAPTRFAGAVVDVTEQVLAAREMEHARDVALEASRQKSAFLATMSHEIRTPMNAVIGMTGLLLDTPLDADQRDFVETVRGSGDALLGIINDILDFSKIEAGGLRLEQQSFDLRECVEDALDVVAATASANGLELVLQIDERTPTHVVGDVTRLRQVLVNLLGNATKFTSEGEVVLEVAPDERTTGTGGPEDDSTHLRFAVTDTGIGIPAERLASLFDSFSQVDASTTRLYGGTGLGLAISQRLVKAMGGVLEVESVSGAGSCFHFSVALGTAAGAAGAAGVGFDRSRGELAGRAVLVVDDNATNRRILRAQLEGWGMAVSEAADGPAALALAAPGGSGGAGRFDVAVLDMKMPGMSGQDLAVALRAAPATAGTALVLLGSRGERAALDRHDLFAAVLSKPVRAARLHQCLRQALGDHDAAPAATVTAAAAGGTGMRVLLAEDNVVNQRLGRLMLEKLGHRVDIVGNGAEAAQAVHLVPYDAVLMDVEMPVMDGLEATRVIRAEVPARRQPRIVALTASALVEDRQACANAGMDDYLSKPVRLHDLDAALNRAARAPSTEPEAVTSHAEVAVDAGVIDTLVDDLGDDGAAHVAELITAYLHETDDQMAALSDATAHRDLQAVGAVAHKMQSATALLGAGTLAALLADARTAARHDGIGLDRLTTLVETEHRRVVTEMADTLQRLSPHPHLRATPAAPSGPPGAR